MTRRQSAVAAAQGLLPEPKVSWPASVCLLLIVSTTCTTADILSVTLQAGEPGWGATKPRTGLSKRDLNVPAPAPAAATAKESKRRAGSSMS